MSDVATQVLFVIFYTISKYLQWTLQRRNIKRILEREMED